jgi:hypothetical protein
MAMRIRHTLFLTALTGALCAPLAAQAAQAQAIPDFSGKWSHPGLGFDSPLSGPGPVRNKSRLPSGASNFNLLVGDYSNPILKPEAAETVKKFGEISLSGRAFPDPDSQCRLNPVPYIFWNFVVQILQQPGKVTLIYQHDSAYRQVRLNGQHPTNVVPSIHGDSIGHYENGDTLVIDTVGVKTAPYPMADRFGTPFTSSLHVVERYRLIDYDATKAALERAEKEWPRVGAYGVDPNYRGKGLQLEFTVEDPNVFTTPWKGLITYGQAELKDWEERVCAENIGHYYGESSYYSDKNARVPMADKADF